MWQNDNSVKYTIYKHFFFNNEQPDYNRFKMATVLLIIMNNLHL